MPEDVVASHLKTGRLKRALEDRCAPHPGYHLFYPSRRRMDAAIHARILPDLLRWFYDQDTRNTFDSQLWLKRHSAALLDDLNREEIVICETDREGRSRVYSLMAVQMKVRRDDNHYKRYLCGAYGGAPMMG